MTKAQSPTSITDRRVIGFNEAAAIANVSPSTLKRRCKAGELKLTRMSPRRVGILSDHLDEWLRSRTG